MITKDVREYTLDRLKSKSFPSNTGCVEWFGTKTKNGYGLISFTPVIHKRMMTTTHRAMWMCVNNVILDRNIYVCHRCDNPGCINIDHLFIGTAKENNTDMLEKGRNAKKHKLHTRIRVLTNEQILAIKNEPGGLTSVARKFSVSVSYVWKLKNGKAKTLVDNSPSPHHPNQRLIQL